MITKFKIYEAENGKPKIGNYIACKTAKHLLDIPYKDTNIEELIALDNKIGQIIDIQKRDLDLDNYLVEYEHVPEGYSVSGFPNSRWIKTDDILGWSKNKEDLEEILATKKYNL